MNAPFQVVIPARYASSRLPGKPLADIGGKPMVVRVLERAMAAGAESVWVATDHADVLNAVETAKGQALMISTEHASGTDRIAELAQRLGWTEDTIVVNVQGDEPLIDPALIQNLAQTLAQNPGTAIATAAHPIDRAEDFFNPNVVKVVSNAQGDAAYFSRAPIPWARDAFAKAPHTLPKPFPALRHVGLYAYRCAFLKRYATLSPSPLETLEALEQLRALWHGYRISLLTLPHAPAAGVDTPEDLARVRALFDRQAKLA